MVEDRRIDYKAANDSELSLIIWPLLLACLLLALWLGYWQNSSFLQRGPKAEVEMTPISESVAISSESSESTAEVSAVNDSTSNSNSANSSSDGSSVLSGGIVLNSTLIVAEAAAETKDRGLRLYATASFSSATREIYNSGDRFTLVEPSEDFEVYPVEVEGVSWVRVRDSDGLLGWADMSLLVAE